MSGTKVVTSGGVQAGCIRRVAEARAGQGQRSAMSFDSLTVAAREAVAYSANKAEQRANKGAEMAGEAAAVIGKSVQIRGEVKGNEDLLVEGLVEGTVTLTDHRLTIGANARVQANVSARDVVVQGTLHGDAHASGRVELRAGCHMTGDIHAARLSIEENAILSGKVELNASASAEKPAAAAHAGATPAATFAG